MPPDDDPLTHSQQTSTGLSDRTQNSTSTTASRYSLNDHDANPILLYNYRCPGGPDNKKLQRSSQKDLCEWLDKGASETNDCRHSTFANIIPEEADVRHRVTRKPIPRFTSYLDIQRQDLFLPEEKDQYMGFPNFHSSLASVKVPSRVYWERAFGPRFQELFIVSGETGGGEGEEQEQERGRMGRETE